MNVDISGFKELFDTLRSVDLVGEGPPDVPWGEKAPTASDLRAAIAPGEPVLPRVYRTGYVQPLLDSLDDLIARHVGVTELESLAGAVYDHVSTDESVTGGLHRFLAVVSNLYRSFLDASSRSAAGLPMTETLPPLAMFQHTGQDGPFTLPVDDVQWLINSTVGVVSLPSVYRAHPLLWPSLAHEVGGHDVLHADPDLLPELRDGVRQIFGGGDIGGASQMTGTKFLGMLWAYWMDETASDIYGVLNIGPTFGMNLAVFFGALNAAFTGATTPSLRTASGADPSGRLDPHPTDILRLDVIRGAVESLTGLSQETRDAYATALDSLSQMCGGDAPFITLQGALVSENGATFPVHTKAPMAAMKAAARTVGSFLVTTKLKALNGHGIQDIETWDNPDEAAAQAVAQALSGNASAVKMGDDAQLLAGATLAAFADPGKYKAITSGLADALDDSWDRDPIWSVPGPDPARLATVIVDEEEFGAHIQISWV